MILKTREPFDPMEMAFRKEYREMQALHGKLQWSVKRNRLNYELVR